MGPHFQGYPAAGYCAEHLRHGLLAAPHAAFQHYLARFVQHAVAAALIPQVQTDRDWASLLARLLAGPVDFPAHFVCPFTRALFRGVILLHGRLLFALRVRSHWELIASRWEPAFSFHLSRTNGTRVCPTSNVAGEILLVPDYDQRYRVNAITKGIVTKDRRGVWLKSP